MQDRLNITATDLDQAIRTSAAVKVKKPGACTIPARKLYDYIKLLPDGDISIKLLENHWVQIRSGRSNTKMVGMARANYPQVPEFPTIAVTSIPLACAPHSHRPHHLRHLERRVALHAQRRAAHSQGGVARHGGDRRSPALVRRKARRNARRHQRRKARAGSAQGAAGAATAALVNTEAEKVEFADDEHTLFFRVGHRTLSSRKLSGQFPNFEAVMPRDNTKFAVVRSSELSAAIQRVAQFADERSGAIRMRLEDNELKVSANSTESGESEDTIDTPYSGDPIVVGFNSVYILDFLKALDNEGEVRLEFKDSQSAGQMRPEDPDAEYKYRYVLMPMRI